ncbi:MAG: hypothetical protein JL50_16765 [Peptococcaceae bacterium BICA1-7]|nr:MAG: hypothetical protein JL50_16765 [Peptococcaceae bacterium BICA1-7]HBV96555.1 DUF3795 domain-containing protein [Desulfotomaculum sp.]
MKYQDILSRLAPCGLDCGRCADWENSEIRHYSQRLTRFLGGYDRVAGMKSQSLPLFKNYQHFKEILEAFAAGPCGGCRSDTNCCFIQCRAKDCLNEKKIDFCFQCDEFPCDSQFTGPMREKWLQRNNRMKEVGVEEFYQDQLKIPRY